MTGYELSRSFWDFSFENPEIISPYHSAIFFFAIEHCNRLGWKEKFGFPTSMVMDATGIKSYRKYKSSFDDLCKWDFFKVIELSKNQYSSNIISLNAPASQAKAQAKAQVKALDKAMIKHATKQRESTVQSTSESIDSINKHITLEPLNIKQTKKEDSNFENLPESEILIQKAIEKSKAFFAEYTDMQQLLTEQARIKDPKFDFFAELQNWIRFNGENQTLIRYPEKSIPSKFASWLKNYNQFSGNQKLITQRRMPEQSPKSIPKPIKQHYK